MLVGIDIDVKTSYTRTSRSKNLEDLKEVGSGLRVDLWSDFAAAPGGTR